MRLTHDIAILILAAGGSSRMGQPKQLLPWGTTNLLGQAIQKSKQLSTSIFVVLGANFEAISAAIKNEPVSIIYHDKWQMGLGSSIAKGVSEIPVQKYKGLLIMLADQPMLAASHYQKLIASFNVNTNKIVATQYEDKTGVPAVFNSQLSTELMQLGEDYGAAKIIKKYEDKLIALRSEQSTVDIDTPDEYHRLRIKTSPDKRR